MSSTNTSILPGSTGSDENLAAAPAKKGTPEKPPPTSPKPAKMAMEELETGTPEKPPPEGVAAPSNA